jgi:hypothetical protein
MAVSINFQNDGDLMYAPGVLDGGTSPDSDVDHHEQQSWLSPGGDASANDGAATTATSPPRDRHGIEDPNMDYAALHRVWDGMPKGPSQIP